MTSGTVKWYSNKKGVGFISQENGDDVLVHSIAIQGEGSKTLSRGDKVEFEIEVNRKSRKASKVVKL